MDKLDERVRWTRYWTSRVDELNRQVSCKSKVGESGRRVRWPFEVEGLGGRMM